MPDSRECTGWPPRACPTGPGGPGLREGGADRTPFAPEVSDVRRVATAGPVSRFDPRSFVKRTACSRGRDDPQNRFDRENCVYVNRLTCFLQSYPFGTP